MSELKRPGKPSHDPPAVIGFDQATNYKSKSYKGILSKISIVLQHISKGV